MPGPGTGSNSKRETLRAALVAAATVAVYFVLAWSALLGQLERDARATEDALAHGLRWTFDSTRDLIGRAPFGAFEEFTLQDGRILGRSGAREGYLSLQLGRFPIDAERFSILRARLSVQAPARLLLFHREALDAPALALAPIELAAGTHDLRVELSDGAWRGEDGHTARWGGKAGRVATLRIHPASGAATRFTIDEIALEPAQAWTARPVTRWPNHTPGALVHDDWRWERPEALLARRDALLDDRPHASITVDAPLPAMPTSAPRGLSAAVVSVLCVLLAGPLFAGRRRASSAAAALAGLLIGVGWLLVTPAAPLGSTAVAVAVTIVLLIVLLRYRSAPHGIREWVGDAAAWRAAVLWSMILALPAVLVLILAPDGSLHDAHAGRLLRYVPWATVQQLILIGVLAVLARAILVEERSALSVAAALFGLLHYPNFTLMTATAALGWLCLHLWHRHRALAPLVVLHAALGTLYLETTAPFLFRSGDIGRAFFN